jgi:branched-chain amino acid transport system permease protein
MVYGVLKLINFAHGDVYMVGAFAGYWLGELIDVRSPYSANPPGGGEIFIKATAVTLGAMIICGALAFTIERFAYRPLRQRPRLTALITAIGVSFLLEYGFQLSPWIREPIQFPPGPSPRIFPTLLPRVGYEHFGVNYSNYDLIGFAAALLLMAGLQFIVYRTKFGTAMRAVSFDPQVAGLMGIAVDRIITWTFIIGAALAAAAGIINAISRPKIEPLFGLMTGLKAFVAAVLGGIGSVPGAMVGGLMLGLVEGYVVGYTDSRFRDAIAFAVLILVLLVRPAGLFGRVTVEKV